MLDLDALNLQFSGFGRYQSRERERKAVILGKVLEVFRSRRGAEAPSGGMAPGALQEGRTDQLLAVPLEDPTAVYDPVVRPTPLTLVATDGSQIYPDRNIEPLCYLLNIGRVAFQYGTTERPLLDAVPHLYFRGQELAALSGLEIDIAGRDIVSALRDELELGELAGLAGASRKAGRPTLAVSDGTLIRWVLRRLRRPDLEQALLERYVASLEEFRIQQIPLCSYISMPGATEFINYLSRYAGTDVSRDRPFEGISDRMLFEKVLRPGQRSGVFASQSLVLNEYPHVHRVCYFYVHVSGAGASEIARVEFPFWIAEQTELLDLMHAAILSECEKGGGYPMILSEAHEHAVVRAPERAMFYEMIEREMQKEGAVMEVSQKSTSKANPTI